MAKVIFSSLIDDISGKFGGSIFKRVKSGTILRQSQRPANPRSSHQQRTRRIFNDLSGRWYSLTATQQSLWDHFASLSPGRMSGFNAYLKLNTRLLSANYSTLVRIDSPPLTPSTPEHIEGLSVESLSNTKNIIGWTSPKSYSYFTQTFFAVSPGYSFRNKEKWRLIETKPSISAYISHNHTYPAGTSLHYKARTIDSKGRISSLSLTNFISIPSTLLYIVDSSNNRIKKHFSTTLLFSCKFGSHGSGDDYFNLPTGIALDENYAYIVDSNNFRIKKHLRSDFSFIAKIGSEGSGNDQFNYPGGICSDGTYLYVADTFNHRIFKRLCSDLSYISKIGSLGTGDDEFNHPKSLSTDGTYLYIADNDNHRIFKRNCSDLSYISKIGSEGSGNDQFNHPYDIDNDGTYLYITDGGNARIVKRLCSDLSYVSKSGSYGTGDGQFLWPNSLTHYNSHLFITDATSHELKKHLMSDLSFVSRIGTQGNADNQFYNPRGIALWQS